MVHADDSEGLANTVAINGYVVRANFSQKGSVLSAVCGMLMLPMIEASLVVTHSLGSFLVVRGIVKSWSLLASGFLAACSCSGMSIWHFILFLIWLFMITHFICSHPRYCQLNIP